MAILDMRVVAGHERVAELNMREGDGSKRESTSGRGRYSHSPPVRKGEVTVEAERWFTWVFIH